LGGVGFLTTLGVGFFCPTPDANLDNFLHHTPKLGIPVEMVQVVVRLLPTNFLPRRRFFGMSSKKRSSLSRWGPILEVEQRWSPAFCPDFQGFCPNFQEFCPYF